MDLLACGLGQAGVAHERKEPPLQSGVPARPVEDAVEKAHTITAAVAKGREPAAQEVLRGQSQAQRTVHAVLQLAAREGCCAID